ncbi:MAG: YciI-like protein [Anaerolineae bacterium]
MGYYVLLYTVVDNFIDRRAPFRSAHLQLVDDAQRRGHLVMAGALGDPPDGALLVFQAAERSAVEDFARHDPYVLNGVVTGWEVRPWHVVTSAQ